MKLTAELDTINKQYKGLVSASRKSPCPVIIIKVLNYTPHTFCRPGWCTIHTVTKACIGACAMDRTF